MPRYVDVTGLARVGESPAVAELPPELAEQLVGSLTIEARYAGYIGRQNDEIERQKRQAATPLPDELDYALVRGTLDRSPREARAHSAAGPRPGLAHLRA